jgi:hypothetical protein
VTIALNNRGEDRHNLDILGGGAEGTLLEISETKSLQRNLTTFDRSRRVADVRLVG